jgi:hypothetical protein
LIFGKAYFDATLVENNHHGAFRWICRSAEQGNMEAQFRLGDLYALGYGTAKHFPDAYRWYTKAAIQGYKKALIRIHNLYQGDVKIQCRGQINSKEYGRDAQYRIQERKVVSNFAIDYYSDQFNHYRSSNQEDPSVHLNLHFSTSMVMVSRSVSNGLLSTMKRRLSKEIKMHNTTLVICTKSTLTSSLIIDKPLNGTRNLLKVETLLPRNL